MTERVLATVAAEASRRAGEWFPDLDAGRVRVRPVSSDARARCFLHMVDLDDGRLVRPVVVKVRHSVPQLRRLDRYESRPVLTPERTLSDAESARLEYDALRDIERAVAPAEPGRFGVLRALAWLPEESGIVMDLVREPTLRDRLLRTSRLQRRPRAPMPATPWHNAGAWLRVFHDEVPGHGLPTRLAHRDQVAALMGEQAAFLGEQLGDPPALRRVRETACELVGAFPSELPLAAGHGDFVANNMFASENGRVTVFDPLPRWRVPRYQDLATLTVGLRALPLNATSQGLAFGPEDLPRYERAFLAGYFGEDVPVSAVRVYQLVVLLDRWAALVSKTTRGGAARSGVRAARVRLTSRFLQRECGRLLGDLTPERRVH
ncbi:MAG TPA: hypothetical protein VFZ64_10910 [Nocardioidaceae bacterium]